MKVYVIIRYDYSQTFVDAVFSKKEDAETYAKNKNKIEGRGTYIEKNMNHPEGREVTNIAYVVEEFEVDQNIIK